jgi:hypothetical protein
MYYEKVFYDESISIEFGNINFQSFVYNIGQI